MNEYEARQEANRIYGNLFFGAIPFYLVVILSGCGKKTAFDSINRPVPPTADVLLEVEVKDEVEGCEKYGAVVTTGLDYNDNGEIELDEIVETEVICNKFYKVKKCKAKKKDDDDEESSDD